MLPIYEILNMRKRFIILGGEKPLMDYNSQELGEVDRKARISIGTHIFTDNLKGSEVKKFHDMGRYDLAYRLNHLFKIYRKLDGREEKTRVIWEEASSLYNYFVIKYGCCPLREYRDLTESETEVYVKNV